MSTNQHTYEIPLLGVESEHCALTVTKALATVKALAHHHVELNNHKAVVETDKEADGIILAVAAIRSAGYDVATKRKQYPVTGMSCASCSASVETILQNQVGVVSAAVNLASQTVQLEYIDTIVTPSALKEALQSVGFDLIVEETAEAKNALEEQQLLHYQRSKQRTWWAIALSIPLVAVGMFFMDMPYANELMWALSTPVVVWFGRHFFVNAWRQLKHRSANMDTLVALSTGIAYSFSVFNTLYPSFWHSRGLHAHVYFEAAAVVITFILVGKLLEEKAKANTSSAIKKLIGLQPSTVTIVRDNNQLEDIPIAQVKVGDVLLVKPGSKIPVDGSITEGASFVDESMITGESIPASKEVNDRVFAGTINQKGSFRMVAAKVGGDTLLASIIRQVQQAQGSKAPVQRLVDKIASIFVPTVIAIAVATFAAWWMLGGDSGLTHGLLAAITVLVIACPCALGLATPTAIMVGVGKGAENGILIKDAESLERAHTLNAIVLDKTGTITVGKPTVVAQQWLATEDIPLLRSILYSLERQSEHPLAEAVAASLTDEASLLPLTGIVSQTGQGISAQHQATTYWIGNTSLMQAQGANATAALAQVDEWSSNAYTVVYFGRGSELLAVLAIADQIKESSAAAIAQLQQMGIEVLMLTGDNRQTAAAVAHQVGIARYQAEALPSDKASFIKELQQQGKVVGMVGDGINDSEALALANVSIAMGRGSDIAIDVAMMTLISNDLRKIPAAITLSRKTVATIRQNLFWAFIYNLIGIPVAAGALYAVSGFMLNPMIAGAAMALSSVSVVSNSLRLKRIKFDV